jgi:serine/threonine protein kinase
MVYRGVCSVTHVPVIIKAYEKAKMKPKNFTRMDREVRLMRLLGGGNGLVELLAVFEDSICTYLVGIPFSKISSDFVRRESPITWSELQWCC